MARFRHSHQLNQLKRLDRVAYVQAKALVDRRAFSSAAVVIKAAMHRALERLTAPAPAFPGDGGVDSYDHLIGDKNRWPWPANVKE